MVSAISDLPELKINGEDSLRKLWDEKEAFIAWYSAEFAAEMWENVTEYEGGKRYWEEDVKRLTKHFKNEISNSKPSRPFTEGAEFLGDLFDESGPEELDLLPDPHSEMDSVGELVIKDLGVYREAAERLEENDLWKAAKSHLSLASNTGCRTLIDMVLLSAVQIAQQLIIDDDVVDKDLAGRHSFKQRPVKLPGIGKEIRNWILLEHDVAVPDLDVKPNVVVHGILDYVVGVVATDAKVCARIDTSDHRWAFDRERGLSGTDSLRRNTVATVSAVKSLNTFDSEAQALVQGAAMCILERRDSVLNILSDGVYWAFYVVSKLPASSATPFEAVKSPLFDITLPDNLATILRLAVVSIIHPGENFAKMAVERTS
ncbi:hypothetical protein B0H11DRAFT_2357385 [Mycena galericulata]|nr:hypothetical protein B0H11DRAFT_2357385 [Mycena galericulata]